MRGRRRLLAALACIAVGTTLEAVATSTASAENPAPSGDAHSGDTQSIDARSAYDAHDYKTAQALWETQARAGDIEAAYQLGILYDLGQGGNSAPGEAYRWYLRAATGGMQAAEFNVAVMLDSGQGVARDASSAALWYGRAATHDNRRAALNLAHLYTTGDGVPYNAEAASAWLQVAADQILVARQRLVELRQQQAASSRSARQDLAVPPTPVMLGPVSPVPVPGSNTDLELVWTAPAAAAKTEYFVSVAALDHASWKPIFGSYTTRTALLVPPVSGQSCYAWRVYTVSAGMDDYAASAWHQFGCGQDRLVPAAAD